MSWINEEMLDFDKHIGIVYKIERINPETNEVIYTYFGKKLVITNKKVKLTKKELANLPVKPGKKPTHKRVLTETDWRKYWSSNKEIQKEVKELGDSHFKRTILYACESKKSMAYLENKILFGKEVLERPDLYKNDNIGGSFYRKDASGYIQLIADI